MKRLFALLGLGLVLCFIGAGCQNTTADAAVAQTALEALPTQAVIAPTLTPSPSVLLTLIPTVTPMLPPTYTRAPEATQTPRPTNTATAVPETLSCPAEPKLKPAYERAVLGKKPWPRPLPDSQTHLWLEKPLPGGGRYLFNTDYPYGWDGSGTYLLHNGIDTGAALGTAVLAVAEGTVIVAGPDDNALYGWRCNWYGHLVVVEHDQQWLGQPVYSLYGHVLEIKVEVGQKVAAGDQLAEVGIGGAAVVPHLHFEVRVGANDFGSTQNPLLWIRPPESRGLIAGRLIDPEGRPWQGVWLIARSLGGGENEYTTWSYLDDPTHMVNSDAGLAENFVISDVKPGEYRLYAQVQGVNYSADVTVIGGTLSTVEIMTEPYKTPTPTATP